MKVAILLLCLVLAASANQDQSKFAITDASVVLHDLLKEANQNLSELRAAWEEKRPLLEAAVAALEAELASKQEECAGLDDVLAKREKELKDAEDYVAWLEKRIAENKATIEKLLADRCAQNGNYIEGLKNDKIALKLLQFLRAQISNKDSFSLAQRKSLAENVMNFLSVYHSGNKQALALLEKQFVESSQYDVVSDQSTHDRTAEEIGTSHQDNNVGNLDVANFENGERKGWVQVRDELLDLLQNLENVIREKMAKAQEDEINASTAAADYKLALEHEVEVYEGELARWRQNVAHLIVLVAQDTENVNACRSQEAAISAQLTAAREDLANQTAEFNRRQAGFEEEVAVFEEVIALYDESTGNQGEDFQARADDYIDDATFNNGSYNEREVPKIGLLDF